MTIKNSDDLRELLSNVIEKAIEGTIAPNQANAVSNLVGKFVQTVQLDMKYHQMKDSMPTLKFLQNSTAVKEISHDKETGEINESSSR
jgi:phosphoribosylformimino-5-aminoimidazole carboxamide ribonucleotide (ProFAR) isomerase